MVFVNEGKDTLKKKKIQISVIIGLILSLVCFHAWGMETVWSGIAGVAAGTGGTSLSPWLGPVGGVIYGAAQVRHHVKRDVRQWTKNSSHRQQIRSWVLNLYSNGATLPSSQIPGFCTPGAAMIYAARYPQFKSQVVPNPLPCTHMKGLGAWGSP